MSLVESFQNIWCFTNTFPSAFVCLSTNGFLMSTTNQKRSLSHISGSELSTSGAHILEDTHFVYSTVTRLVSAFYILALFRDILTNNKLLLTYVSSNKSTF